MPKTFKNIGELTNEWSQAIVAEIYKKSQELAPVKSGKLKSSGNFKYGASGGGKVSYTAPHANKIGNNASRSQSSTAKVASSRRTLRSGKNVMVRNYTRRVPKKTNKTPSQTSKSNFLDRATIEVMTNSKLLERLWLQVGGGSTPVIESKE